MGCDGGGGGGAGGGKETTVLRGGREGPEEEAAAAAVVVATLGNDFVTQLLLPDVCATFSATAADIAAAISCGENVASGSSDSVNRISSVVVVGPADSMCGLALLPALLPLPGCVPLDTVERLTEIGEGVVAFTDADSDALLVPSAVMETPCAPVPPSST